MPSWRVFAYFYVKYERVVDRRMAGRNLQQRGQDLRAAARGCRRRKAGAEEVAADLRRAGYAEGGSDGGSRVGHYSRDARRIEIVPGPAVVSRLQQRDDSLQRRQGRLHHRERRTEPGSAGLRTGAAIGDRAVRRAGPLQARAHQVRRHSAGAGQRGAGHRRPPLLPAQRRELLPPDGSGVDRRARRPPRTRRIDAHHAAVARLFPQSRRRP